MAPIHHAALNGQCDMIQHLLDKGADGNAKTNLGVDSILIRHTLKLH